LVMPINTVVFAAEELEISDSVIAVLNASE
jgi:Skp family chaperone for outer membrane proteins